MMTWLIPVGVFVLSVSAIVGLCTMAARLPAQARERKLQRRLAAVGGVTAPPELSEAPSDLIKHAADGPWPGLDRLIERTGRGSRFSRWLEQTGLRITASGVLVIAMGLGALAWFVVWIVNPLPVVAAAAAALGAAAPFFVLLQRRASRLKKFEERFPEALDLISRAVRAGHGFVAGLKMVADELDAPVGQEFRKTFDEQNFGLPLKDALGNFSERIPLLDVRFFTTAVLIQRETGGNLSEILENLAHVVRERFKILRQVRVHTAHGRFTGWVLMALPAALAIVLSFINPDHTNLLFRESMGKTMVAGAVIMQVIGYLWIKRVIKIEV